MSCDPIYRYDVEQIRSRIESTYSQILEQTRQNLDEFVWTSIRSVDELGAVRMAAMNDFLADYAAGKAQARYIDAELPNLPFPDLSFDLALCSHFLFLYSTQLGEAFHQSAIRRNVPCGQRGSHLPAVGARVDLVPTGRPDRGFV